MYPRFTVLYKAMSQLGQKASDGIRVQTYSTVLLTPQKNPKIPNTKLFINNEWVDSNTGETYTTINPTTGDPITKIQKGKKIDVDRAVKAAKEAFKLGSPWRTMDASQRGNLIHKLADLLERDSVYLSSLEALECGKLYSVALKNDMPQAVKFLRYFGGLADKINGISTPLDGNHFAYTRQEALGVAALITAWNFPTQLVCYKMSQALAAGCTVVLKPSQYSAMTILHLAQLIKETGFPPGVVNVIPGDSEVSLHLSEHLDIDKISFTGSTHVGQELMKKATGNVKKLTLNLSGKSPSFVLASANLDKAVKYSHEAAFYNMGQCCSAASRTFVHESLYEKFIEKSKALIKRKIIGDPFDVNVEHGPQIAEGPMKNVLKCIDMGVKEGAKLEEGGFRIDREGYYIQPTLFTDVKDSMTISREEIFGPVQQISSFKDIDEVIERANDSVYGLGAFVFGNNIDEITTITHNVRVGNVWVNCYLLIPPNTPFGGYKLSGIGRESGLDGVKAFTETKTIIIKTLNKNS